MTTLYLASNSPRRKQLLTDAGIPFTIKTSEVEEVFPDNMEAQKVPLFLAQKKADALWNALEKTENVGVIAADTVVIINNEIIGKPRDATHAKQILQQLSGKKHEVITGVVVKSSNVNLALDSVTEVYFRKLSEQQIDFYVNKYQPFDKAGAYAIQEWIGLIGIEKIAGDFYNVMGLPVNKVVQELYQLFPDILERISDGNIKI